MNSQCTCTSFIQGHCLTMFHNRTIDLISPYKYAAYHFALLTTFTPSKINLLAILMKEKKTLTGLCIEVANSGYLHVLYKHSSVFLLIKLSHLQMAIINYDASCASTNDRLLCMIYGHVFSKLIALKQSILEYFNL